MSATVNIESFWQGKRVIMLFVLMATYMVKGEAVGMQLLNVVLYGCKNRKVIPEGVPGVHVCTGLVDLLNNAIVVTVHLYWSGVFQGERE